MSIEAFAAARGASKTRSATDIAAAAETFAGDAATLDRAIASAN